MQRRAGPPASFLALALLLGACKSDEDPNLIRLNGRVEAVQVDLAPKVAGRVVEVKVREGDRVSKGDLLVTLDLGETALAVERDRAGVKSAEARAMDLESGSRSSEIEAAQADVNEKRAASSLAEKELARRASLLEKKVGSQEEYDRARADRDRAAAALRASLERLDIQREGFRRWQTEQARTDVRRAESVLKQSESVAREAEIRAPADGVVLHRIAEPGLLLGPSQPGIVMAFAERLYVRVFIPETKLGRVAQGQAAEVSVDAFPGRTFPARVTEISPDPEFTPKQVETRSERVNLVYGAKVDLDRGWREPLVPGQPATVVVKATPG